MSRRTPILIFTLTLFACVWFYSPGLWNQTARNDSIQALAERGTFCIDAYLPDPEHYDNTGDWSYANGHYFSNKAPGTMFLGAATYAPLYWLERLFLREAPGPRLQAANFWWVNFWCSAMPTALLAVILYLLLRRLCVSEIRARFWSVALILCTTLFPYAGQMWGHNLAAALLAFALLQALPHDEICHPQKNLFLAGLFAGLAVVTDYLAIAAIPALALLLLLQRRWKEAPHFVIGGLPALALYCFYHWKCFGNPVLPATFFNNPGFLDSAATGGIVAGFKTNVVAQLLIGASHGLLWCAPLAIFAIPSTRALWKRGGNHRRLALAALVWFLLSLALNASFNGWHGGSGIGPRYLLPAFPAWGILAAFAPIHSRRQKLIVFTLALLSAANMFVVAALTPLASEVLFNPYTTYLAHFLKGFWHLPSQVRPAWSPAALIGFRPWSDLLCFLPFTFGMTRLLHLKERLPKRQAIAQIRSKTLRFAQNNWAILLALTLLFILPSFVGLMGDEALLQAHAFESNRMLSWAKSGLVGSVGQAYGPLAIWFYQLLQMLTPNPIHIVLLKTLLVGAGSLAMLRFLAREMSLPARLPALLFLLAPYSWHWTRCLWDNVLQLPLELASLASFVAFLRGCDHPEACTSRKVAFLTGSALAAIAAVWLHSMALPFLATLPTFLVLFRRDLLRREWRTVLVVVFVGSLLLGSFLVPRLQQSRQAFSSQSTYNRTAKVSFLKAAGNALIFPTILSGATFEERQMTASIPDFPALWKSLWRTLGYTMLALTICLLAAGLVETLRTRSHIGLFALLNLVLQALFILATRLQFFPHYHQPILVSSLLLAALGANALRQKLRNPRLGTTLWRSWCALGAASILVFLSHLALTGGQDAPPYGMTLHEQWRALRTVQRHALAGQSINLVANTWQYASLPVCLNILANLAQTEQIGRLPPQSTPENHPLKRTWVLLNPIEGCGFLRIADTTDPSSPHDIPLE